MPRSERRRRLARLTGLLAAMVIASAGCGRVYPVVALPTISLADASFFPTVDAYTSAPIVPGNAVDILLNGEQIFPAVVDAIRSARRTITYAQYYYEDGPVVDDVFATARTSTIGRSP